MMTESTVYLIDDDLRVLHSLRWLIESHGLRAKPISSAPAFLEVYEPHIPGCLILDIRMPEMTGLQLLEKLKEQGIRVPVIVMTGFSDVGTVTESFRNGAFDFIQKPADHDFLLTRIRAALLLDEERCRMQNAQHEVRRRVETLTPRERQVMDAIVCGKPQKLVAAELGISFQTAAKHRAKVLKKLDATTDVEVLRRLLPLKQTFEDVLRVMSFEGDLLTNHSAAGQVCVEQIGQLPGLQLEGDTDLADGVVNGSHLGPADRRPRPLRRACRAGSQ